MTVPLDTLKEWLQRDEDERLEFKEAKRNFSSERLFGYCAALANEGGGHLVLGVTDSHPRAIVGTQLFPNPQEITYRLLQELRLRVEVGEPCPPHPSGRVLIFEVPSRPVGVPVDYRGRYLMRSGESVVPMTPDQLHRILDEGGTDFSAEVCPGAAMGDLRPDAIERFQEMWGRKSANAAVASKSAGDLLRDAELLLDDGLTYAALVLFGERRALGRLLAQAEIVFEYRGSDAPGPASQRKEHRVGFFASDRDLWETINLRNELQHYQDGLFVWDIPTFNETVVREAILNAVSHRDYRLPGSVFVRQYPKRLEVESPGGFPPGITPENVLWKQSPRNRRIAEAFARCGLVERAGQGMDRMFGECIRESKKQPDFTGTDDHQVVMTLHGEVQEPQFLRFLEKVGRKGSISFTVDDLVALDLIRCEQPVRGERVQQRLPVLEEQGLIESIGRGRSRRYILSRRLYGFIGKKGVYTRKRGLDRSTRKELLLKHIRENAREGSPLRDLLDVLPGTPKGTVQNWLQELKAEGEVLCKGRTKGARWFPTQGE